MYVGIEEENKWLDGQIDGKLALTKGGQAGDRTRRKEMKRGEKAEQKIPELFFRE